MSFVLCIPTLVAAVILGAAPATPSPTPFPRVVLGASLFKAAWAYRHDRPWLESQLKWLQAHRFDAIRAFGVVGDPSHADYWDGREIDWRWEDYASVIAGTTDLAHDKYGITVQWTIFADAQKNTPREADRAAVIDEFLRMARGREHKILAFEVANEFWQNGFEGTDGVRQLRAFAARLRAGTAVPVAASAHADALCPVYASGAVDFVSMHFDRTSPAARWTPLVQPWRTARLKGHFARCELPQWASNNEPLGLGSSLEQPLTPLQVVMSAVNTYLAGIPIYVFHTGPGVRDDPAHPEGLRPLRLDQLPDAEPFFGGLEATKRYVPADVISWLSVTPDDKGFPFTVKGQVVSSLGAVRNDRFIVSFSGVGGKLELLARKRVEGRLIDPLTGATIETRRLERGEKWLVTSEAVVVSGSQRDP